MGVRLWGGPVGGVKRLCAYVCVGGEGTRSWEQARDEGKEEVAGGTCSRPCLGSVIHSCPCGTLHGAKPWLFLPGATGATL